MARSISRIFLRRKAISTIVGATFFIVILMASLGVVAWEIVRYDSYMQIARSSESWDRERQNEKIQIVDISVSSGKPSMTVGNKGSVTAHLVSLWITEYRKGTSTWRRSFDLTRHQYFLNPGTSEENVGSDLDVNMQSSNDYGYFIVIVTGRGNVATQYYSGLQTEPPALIYVDGSMMIGGWKVVSGGWWWWNHWSTWFSYRASNITWSTLKQGYMTPKPSSWGDWYNNLPVGTKTLWMKATFKNNSTFDLTVGGSILLTMVVTKYTNDQSQEVSVDDVVFIRGTVAQNSTWWWWWHGWQGGAYYYTTVTIPGGGQADVNFILDQYDSLFNAPNLSTGPKGKSGLPWAMVTSIALSSQETSNFQYSGTFTVDGLLITSG